MGIGHDPLLMEDHFNSFTKNKSLGKYQKFIRKIKEKKWRDKKYNFDKL